MNKSGEISNLVNFAGSRLPASRGLKPRQRTLERIEPPLFDFSVEPAWTKVKTLIEKDAPASLKAANIKARGRVFPSPRRWKDQICYQILPDRFSDGKESQRPVFDPDYPEEFRVRDRISWMKSGLGFRGGTLSGIISKLDYLAGLGVTCILLNPPWKQRKDLDTYHGYGIQNFLEVDPRFGSRQDLRDLIDAAHDRGMYVILDVIFNHSGNNFFYRDDSGAPQDKMPYRFSPPYEIAGWRAADGSCIDVCRSLEDGVWPVEFQNPDWYSRSGEIGNWGLAQGQDPMDPQAEFRRGDFYELKDMNLANPEVMDALIKVYQYWLALSDCDGFRMDALKHVPRQSSREFSSRIWQYAVSIGKENFLLAGEVTDNDMALGYMNVYGSLVDTALPVCLDICSAPDQMTELAKGELDPERFFQRFSTQDVVGRLFQTGEYHVSVVDDHDMSSRKLKQRFSAFSRIEVRDLQAANVIGLQLTTPGIPCIYYGAEQCLDGHEGYHDRSFEPERYDRNRYVRECMFGGDFGSFATAGCHFFNPEHRTYRLIAAMAKLRQADDIVGRLLRGGAVYQRQTAFCGYPFDYAPRGELTAWSRILSEHEVLIVLNANAEESRGANVTVDRSLHADGSELTVLYRNDWSAEELVNPPCQTVTVKHLPDGRAAVWLSLPPAGMAILH
jgi:glycosidase